MPDGLLRVVLKEGVSGKSSITVKGKGVNLVMPSLPIYNLPVVVQLANSDGECWQARYSSTVVNATNLFRAKSD